MNQYHLMTILVFFFLIIVFVMVAALAINQFAINFTAVNFDQNDWYKANLVYIVLSIFFVFVLISIYVHYAHKIHFFKPPSLDTDESGNGGRSSLSRYTTPPSLEVASYA